jgi:PIN domain
VKLRTGVTVETALQILTSLHWGLERPRFTDDVPFLDGSKNRGASQKISAFLDWADEAEHHLAETFADNDLLDDVFSDRYWHIAGLPAESPYGDQIIVHEIDRLWARLDSSISTLKEWRKLGEPLGELLALDTNAFLQYRPFNEIPWTTLTSTEIVRLVLTMPILDEIESKKWGQNERLRKRARKILPLINEILGDAKFDAAPVTKDGTPRPGITFEILRDPPEHRRTSPDMDAEFLDRCEFLQQAAGRPTTVVTADMSMKIRARGRLDGFKCLTVPEKFRLTEDGS